jgi:hypothetical protein
MTSDQHRQAAAEHRAAANAIPRLEYGVRDHDANRHEFMARAHDEQAQSKAQSGHLTQQAAHTEQARAALEKSQQQAAMREQIRQESGQFGHSFDKVCRCGATKGQHMAAAPFDLDETNCRGFKLARKK